jgi:hypothetical protein
MKKILFLTFLFSSCNSTNQIISGKYKTSKSTKIESYFNYVFNKCIVAGDELDLKKDFTFNLSTCSFKATGKWKVKKDTLFLNFETNEVYVDSLVGYRQINNVEELKKRSEYYLIKNKNLYQYNETKEYGICTTKLQLVK